jgi:AT-rich DNA-binding protein
MSDYTAISVQALNRLTRYLQYLRGLPSSPANISATAIAEALEINDVVVRKDLAQASDGGKPKIGYIKEDLIADIEHFLGYNESYDTVLVGTGNLGRALLSYGNFEKYGLNIVAAFDADATVVGREMGGKKVLSSEKIKDICKRLNVKIGIITTPVAASQQVCDALVEGGVSAIWNFAPTHLRVPREVVVKNEDMAASLAILTKQLAENQMQYSEE